MVSDLSENPKNLVPTDWLARHLSDPNLVILDASVIKQGASGAARWRPADQAYLLDGHIPGARFADLLAAFSDPSAPHHFTRPGLAQFFAAAGALGISAQSRIVIYDRGEGIWAARLWWLFRSFGHEAVAVLDGGLTQWRRESRPLATKPVDVMPTTFSGRERQGFFVDKDEVAAVMRGDAAGHLVCVLRRSVFAGTEQSYARPGHIPGSINIPFKEQTDPDRQTLLPLLDLQQSFAPLLRDHDRIILYCGGGITAAGGALALTLLGRRNLTIYDGSLSEWAADPNLPMAVLR